MTLEEKIKDWPLEKLMMTFHVSVTDMWVGKTTWRARKINSDFQDYCEAETPRDAVIKCVLGKSKC